MEIKIKYLLSSVALRVELMRHVLILFDTRVTHGRSGPAISGQLNQTGDNLGILGPLRPPLCLSQEAASNVEVEHQ